MYLNNPPEVDLPISRIEVVQVSVTIPIPTPIKVKLLDKKILDRITLFLRVGETSPTSMKRLIEMSSKYLKTDRGADPERLLDILMLSDPRILLPGNWVVDDLPGHTGIRSTIKYLTKKIENDLFPRMTEHPTNDIERIEELLTMISLREHNRTLQSAIEDQPFLNTFETIIRSLDPDL